MLNYGDLKTSITLFSCQWKKRHDNHGNNTYIRDGDGSLVVNFKHNTSKTVDPFVFPSQCMQVFFAVDDLHPPGSEWKVVLRKEARARRMVEDNDDIFITTNVASTREVSSAELQNHPDEPNLIGAIILNDTENALALQSLERTGQQRRRGNRVNLIDTPRFGKNEVKINGLIEW